jgi:protein phosphatase
MGIRNQTAAATLHEPTRIRESGFVRAVPRPTTTVSPLSVRSFGLTDRGQHRPSNEDQFAVAVLTRALRTDQSSLPQSGIVYAREQGHLFVVADGMGGHRGGERASALALGTIEDFLLNTLKWVLTLESRDERYVLREFREALRRADATVYAEAAQRPELSGMGTTVTMAYCFGSELFVAHVGDSRCYVVRGADFHQLTRDHTLVQQLVDSGILTPEDAGRNPFRNVITNVVGGSDRSLDVEVHKVHLEAGDIVMLCTDGLTRMVDDAHIAEVLGSAPGPDEACKRLIALANEAGGEDNITVVVAHFEDAATGV